MIRACVSIDDGRKDKMPAFGFGFVAWGSGLDDCRVENCLAAVTTDAPKGAEGLLFVTTLAGFADKADKTHIRGCAFTGCVALADAAGIPLVTNNLATTAVEDVRFEGNSYRAPGAGALFVHGETRYSALDDWRKATGQETRDGKSTVRPGNPAVKVPAESRLTDPRALEKSDLFKGLGEK